jgi:hypothetical protein
MSDGVESVFISIMKIVKQVKGLQKDVDNLDKRLTAMLLKRQLSKQRVAEILSMSEENGN